MPATTRGGLQFASFRGIPIRAHFSLLLILPLLAFLFGGAFRRAAEVAHLPPERLAGSPFLWGLVVAVGLFASVLVHELAHTVYALRHGGRVRGITLMMVGGVSELSEAPPRPRDEALMALMGPLTSLGLAAVLAGATWLLRDLHAFNLQFACFYLGTLNLFLGLFNLLPAFPMDGGRIVRAVLTSRWGPLRATRVAAGLGRGFAVLLGLWGLVQLNPLLVLIAFFIFLGAEGEARQVRMKVTLEGIPVAQLMSPRRVGVDVGDSLWDAQWALRRERVPVLPVTEEGRPVGRVTLEALGAVPEDERGHRTTREVMQSPAVTVSLADDGWTAVRRMAEAQVPQLAVVEEDGRLAGTVDVTDVQQTLALHASRTEREERRGPRWRQERPA
ncbi:site-2 protease family protein [Corallococcus sp. M34]|uniref:site-2 protease family protein n=1 Tax=Citreicoccus inhibens TaxID=2849499 RepID=UPI001C24AE3C|nr:site-2 protease family protein [Citreicoccus inhibens]MBU8899095.1 site-2 protease family protein [Citreicoccus inhibens]